MRPWGGTPISRKRGAQHPAGFIEGRGSDVEARHIEAVLETDTELAAERRVREALPPDGYTIAAVEPLENSN